MPRPKGSVRCRPHGGKRETLQKPPEQVRSHGCYFRITASEYLWLKMNAARAGYSMTEYFTRRCCRYLGEK